MRLLLLAFALFAVTSASAQGTGTLAGQVLEDDGVTAVIGANVRVDGTTLGSATDLDGNFRIIGVPLGTYAVTASYVGYQSMSVAGVESEAGTTRQLNFTLYAIKDFPICGMTLDQPLFTNDAIGQSRVSSGRDLENMPVNR